MSTNRKTDYKQTRKWQETCANKRNRQTATRIAQLGESASAEHKQVLNDALRQWADVVKLADHFPKIANLLTADAVYHLIYCEEGHSARYERTIAVTVALAIFKGKTPERCAQLFKSQTAHYQSYSRDRPDSDAPFQVGDYVRRKNCPRSMIFTVAEVRKLPEWDEPAIILRTPKGQRLFPEACSKFILDSEYQDSKEVLQRIDELNAAEPRFSIEGGRLRLVTNNTARPIETAEKTQRPPKQRKSTRRIRVGVRQFEQYGILRGDVATVVMNGEVRLGELGYFSVKHWGSYYKQFLFVCESDDECYWPSGDPKGRKDPQGVCLRYDPKKCDGSHEAETYGRVCAIDRQRQAVEHALTLRPFDGRL